MRRRANVSGMVSKESRQPRLIERRRPVRQSPSPSRRPEKEEEEEGELLPPQFCCRSGAVGSQKENKFPLPGRRRRVGSDTSGRSK